MHEKYRCMQLRKMRCPQLLTLARWMQRIGEQQKTIGEPRSFRRQHAGLPPAIRLSAQPNLFGVLGAKIQDLLAQTFAIPRGVTGTGRAMRPFLSKRQIVAHHFNRVFGKRGCESPQQGRIAIGSSAMCEQKIGHQEYPGRK